MSVKWKYYSFSITVQAQLISTMLIRASPLLLLMMTLNDRASSSQTIPDHPSKLYDLGESIEFSHFVAHPSNQTCSSDAHARPFNNQIRGVNLGGWMVLEPWITPSLFYQFLGGDETKTALDTYSFCQILGPVEANRQLRRHWETWVTEEIIEKLASSDAVNSLRLPVGDYMYVPYGPYSEFFLPCRKRKLVV
jgi:hypothetical protein